MAASSPIQLPTHIGSFSEIPAGLVLGACGNKKTVLSPATRISSTPNSRLVIIRNRFLRRARTLSALGVHVEQFPEEQHGPDGKGKRQITGNHMIRAAGQILPEKARNHADRNEPARIANDCNEEGGGENRPFLTQPIPTEMS